MSSSHFTATLAALLLSAGIALAQDAPKPDAAQPAPPAAEAPKPGEAAPAPGTAQQPAPPAEIVVAPPVTVTLVARPVLFVTGKSNWDDAEASLGQSLNSIFAAIGKANLKAAGPAMIEYLDSSDDDFQFKAMVPLETTPKSSPSKDVKVGQSPAGPALKFVHQGSFEDLEEVYNRIDDYLVAKSLTMKKVFEEYETDPGTTAPDKMVTNIYVVTE
jgi:effector-binding domain-containing protein